MPKVFSAFTLEKFEEAAASVPLRPLDRAFVAAGIGLGEDPGGPAGSRRSRFRRYVASIDRGDARHLHRLGDALGALVGEVATSKREYLVTTAERDGFHFADGAFREFDTSASPFTVSDGKHLSSIADRARRLSVLAEDRPEAAVASALVLARSVARTLLRVANAPEVREDASLGELADATMRAGGGSNDTELTALVRRLSDVVESLAGRPEPSRHEARLVAGIAATLATYLAAGRVDC